MGYVTTWQGGSSFNPTIHGAKTEAGIVARTHLVAQVWHVAGDGQTMRLVSTYRPAPDQLDTAA